jgi:hypothetical protein
MIPVAISREATRLERFEGTSAAGGGVGAVVMWRGSLAVSDDNSGCSVNEFSLAALPADPSVVRLTEATAVKSRYVFGLLIATALVSGAPVVSLAQDAAPPTHEGMQLKLDDLRARLGLTPDQEAKIAPLFQARNEKLKALRASGDPNASRREKFGMMKEARGIQEEFVNQVEPLLTADQKKEWASIRKEMQDAAKERLRERQGQ